MRRRYLLLLFVINDVLNFFTVLVWAVSSGLPQQKTPSFSWSDVRLLHQLQPVHGQEALEELQGEEVQDGKGPLQQVQPDLQQVEHAPPHEERSQDRELDCCRPSWSHSRGLWLDYYYWLWLFEIGFFYAANFNDWLLVFGGDWKVGESSNIFFCCGIKVSFSFV